MSVAEDVCLDIILHWILCNIYTSTRKIVRGKFDKLIQTHRDLNKVSMVKRGETFYRRLNNFKEECKSLFDIRCTDTTRKERQKKLWGGGGGCQGNHSRYPILRRPEGRKGNFILLFFSLRGERICYHRKGGILPCIRSLISIN